MRVICVFVTLVLLASVPAAAPPTDEVSKKARDQYIIGTTYFNLEQWNNAITTWQAGYKLKPDPNFLYNIAQAYRRAGDLEKALTFYRTYLRESPKARNKAEVTQRIRELEKAVAPRQPSPSPAGLLQLP
jgi:tetratricopeptide (TPR) repeat protein